MSLVDKMFEKRPRHNPVFTAIDTLNLPDEIKKFQQDYIKYLEEEGYDEKTAIHNIGYILGYYEDETQQLWYNTLEIDHPYFELRRSALTTNQEVK